MAQGKQVAQANARKQELIAQLAAARQTIGRGKQQFVEQAKPKNLLKKIFSRKPKAMFAGSVVGGLVLTLLLKRPKKSRKGSSPKTTKQLLLTWALSLLKPAAKAWLVTWAKKLAAERISRMQAGDPYRHIPAQQGNVLMDRAEG